ncbi:MAG: YicC/YloC family endoribonuclease [Parvularculaceae bacterium]
MTISSMTGFARADGAHEERRWTWEVKSVNGRGLEVRCRLHGELGHLEADLRKAIARVFSRGSFNVSLFLREEAGAHRHRINERALEMVLAMIERVRARTPCEKPRAEGVLALPGVIEAENGEQDEEAQAAFVAALMASFATAVTALDKGRREEGARLAVIVQEQLDEVARLTAKARASADAAPAVIRDRLAQQLADLLAGAGLPDERLAQEAALLAVRADIREELDRLKGHVAAARTLIGEGGRVGRRLDFLTQEFNREANTLCSKAADMELKRIGLDLKTVIDQMREQVQNIE